jgi:hypothetical protein
MRGGLRKPVTFRFDCELLERARRQASADNRSLTNYVETAVLRAIERTADARDGSTDENSRKTEQEDNGK